MKLRDKIAKIINENEYYQPVGKKDSCFIIEQEEPFFWRLNPNWVKDKADQIFTLFEKEIKSKLK
jgi:hypothetical protein